VVVTQAPAPAPAAAPAQDDLTAQLTQLNNLKAQGLITEDEFVAKKAQLLGL
jgi:membrane protease subunit (stomatin/prohibitin family)